MPALVRKSEDTLIAVREELSAREYARELLTCLKGRTPLQCYGVDANQVQILIAEGIGPRRNGHVCHS